MTTVSERTKTLEALLGFEKPIQQLRLALAVFSWDSDTELVHLSAGHVASILNRLITGRISAVEVENWANTIEGRDDIGFDPAHEQLLRDFIHELANPLITQPLTFERATELRKKIELVSGRQI